MIFLLYFLGWNYFNYLLRIRNLCEPESGIQDGKIRIRDKHPESVTMIKIKN